MPTLSDFRSVDPTVLTDNFFSRIGKDWMLITAVDHAGRLNTMTASWGGVGFLWRKPVAICFIRPQRYTYQITEDTDRLSLSFFAPDECRDALVYCGRNSGRDGDKFAASGLTPIYTADNVPFPAEANLVLNCRKLYADDLKEACFVDPAYLQEYTAKDFHRVYICLIEDVLVRP